jgi:hypothetical protein
VTAFSPPTVDVEAAVRSLLGAARVRLLAWQVEPVAWRVVSEVTGGLHRLRGTAELDGTYYPWSLIVKVGVHPSGPEDASAANGHREALAYTSGILAPKNGFATARLLAVTRPTP